MITVELLYLSFGLSWVVATNGLIILVDPALVVETSGVVYSVVVGMPWVTCPYFEGLVLLSSGVLTFLKVTLVCSFSDSVLRRVIPLFGSGVDNGRIGRDVADVYCLNFFVRIIFDNMSLLSVL